MYSAIFIFVFLSQLCFGFLSTVNFKNEKREYVTYLTQVVNLIRVQKGWNCLNNFELKLNSSDGIHVEKVLAKKISNTNLLDVLTLIIVLLNNVYIEIIRSFLEFLRIIINKCERYSADYLFNKLIVYSELLENSVKKSTILFDKLYKATTFISSLDLKYAFPKIEGNPFVIVDEIYFIKQFVSSIILTNWSYYKTQRGDLVKTTAVTVLSNITNFANEVTRMVFINKLKNNILVNFSYRINIEQILDMEYKTCSNKFSSYNEFILHELDTVYDHIARNGFDEFGFNLLLFPAINNIPSLVPPLDDPNNPGQRIAAMNILIDEINWDSLTGISIQESYQTISLSRVLRDPVDNYNFHLKKIYIIVLFRCKILEVLTEYTSYLTVILQLFGEEKKDLEFAINHVKYVESVYKFFDTVKRTQEFFNNINTAIMNLKKSSIWSQKQADSLLSPIEKLINDYFVLLNKKSLLRDDFFHIENSDMEIIVHKYLSDIKLVRNMLSSKLCDSKRKRLVSCIFESNPRFDQRNFIKMIKKNVAELNNTEINDSITYCQQACVELTKYCENFNNVELKNLGFHKIY
ncbi:uncharacterized protein LOC126907274 isoform X1 [Daktulosphaira vitifoliae]|uniref:uncharacterized protein LOC126907274 isoform X1 n=1 Tax=Daktulosphaira vitifoliae TaxID=58002 RepID=UPI0021AACD3F|nr:uncharacterized protein LOC126907274 isoform X1 [Daktulosphaira vitifoliae]